VGLAVIASLQDIANKAACSSGISPSACKYTMPMYTLWMAAFVGNLVGPEHHELHGLVLQSPSFVWWHAGVQPSSFLVDRVDKRNCEHCRQHAGHCLNWSIQHLSILQFPLTVVPQVMVFAICPFTLFFYEADSDL
jgi:hypothetical protein